jgi:hypothetical protein
VRERLLVLLMQLYPREFRESRSEEILGFIEDRKRATSALLFWSATLADLLAARAPAMDDVASAGHRWTARGSRALSAISAGLCVAPRRRWRRGRRSALALGIGLDTASSASSTACSSSPSL